jgi:hypothetical protein
MTGSQFMRNRSEVMPKVADLNALYPTNCETLLRVRNEYAGWHWYSQHGYIRYHDLTTNQRVYEHKLVAVSAYGCIPDAYQVHHKNEVKTDNRADNLEVLSKSEHRKKHAGQITFVSCTCDVCGKPLSVNIKHYSKRTNHYCDQVCTHIGQRRASWPDAEQLFTLMQEIRNWRAIGQMFNVSDNAVRKWAKNYNLDLSICDGRRKAAYR